MKRRRCFRSLQKEFDDSVTEEEYEPAVKRQCVVRVSSTVTNPPSKPMCMTIDGSVRVRSAEGLCALETFLHLQPGVLSNSGNMLDVAEVIGNTEETKAALDATFGCFVGYNKQLRIGIAPPPPAPWWKRFATYMVTKFPKSAIDVVAKLGPFSASVAAVFLRSGPVTCQ